MADLAMVLAPIAVLVLLGIFSEPLSRLAETLSAWPLGFAQALAAGGYDALADPKRFAVSGSSGAAALVQSVSDWDWWRPVSASNYYDIGDGFDGAFQDNLAAHEWQGRGIVAGAATWAWAMGDGAVRTVTAATAAIVFAWLLKGLLDAVFASKPSGRG